MSIVTFLVLEEKCGLWYQIFLIRLRSQFLSLSHLTVVVELFV